MKTPPVSCPLRLLCAAALHFGTTFAAHGQATVPPPPAIEPQQAAAPATPAPVPTLSTPAPATQAPAPLSGFEAFRTVRTRNIFDPNRRPVRVETPAPAPRPQVSYTPRSRSNSLTLTGTVITNERSLAFFGGSRSEFNKVLTVGDTVAGMKVAAITPAGVTLENGATPTELAVGRYLNLDGGPASGSAPEPVETNDPASPNPETAPAATPAPTGDKNDVLRRMMERREKEMSK